MDYKRNAKFFKPGLSGGAIAFMAFIVLIALLIKPIAGLVALVIVGAILFAIYGGKPSKEEIDQIANDELKTLEGLALKKLGVEKEEVSLAEPLMFWGYSFWTKHGRAVSDEALRECFDVQDKDTGHWRSPVIKLHYFCFSENMIHHYVKSLSLVSATNKETTEEFFYQDIVSAKTDSVDEPAWNFKKQKEDPDKRVHWDSFMLRSSGGDTIECGVYNIDSAESAVNAMRSLLKQKKLQKQ